MIRGAIYRIDLGGGRDGHEQRGRRFGLVISEDDRSWSMVTVIPTSTSAQPSASRVDIEIDGKATLLLVDQIRSIDVRHIHGGAVELLDRIDMARVDAVLARYLGLG